MRENPDSCGFGDVVFVIGIKTNHGGREKRVNLYGEDF